MYGSPSALPCLAVEHLPSTLSNLAKFTPPKLAETRPSIVTEEDELAASFRRLLGLRVDTPIWDCMHGRKPLLMLNETASWSRRRFSVMHELGHMLRHTDSDSQSKKKDEINRFPGAVLAARAAFWREFPRSRGHEGTIMAMKQRWRMSIQALLFRARVLEFLTFAQERTAYMHISKNSWWTNEPGETEAETWTFFRKCSARWSKSGGEGLAKDAAPFGENLAHIALKKRASECSGNIHPIFSR